MAARYVPIRIYLDGDVILEGNASDDGTPDADGVWDALKRVNLGETDAFTKAFGTVTEEAFTIEKRHGASEQPLKITVEATYGGVAETTRLRVRRMPPDGTGRVWRIHPDEVRDLFGHRLIKRSAVARLTEPARSE